MGDDPADEWRWVQKMTDGLPNPSLVSRSSVKRERLDEKKMNEIASA